ncbi:ISA2 (YPR067W) [Zygosaccharomyces parabailii]|nr:ISA2 (YPR067W) [Zygosaccharomyces parabailii]CDH08611.1 related to Iron-sulfur assembly protein 2 [Zygosaccharomyces bailii ISA1307]
MIGRLGVSKFLTRSSIISSRWYAATSAGESLVQPLKVLNPIPGKHFDISQRAADRLEAIYKDSREVLRVKVESGGCHGFQYNLKLIPDSQIQRSIADLKKGNKRTDTDQHHTGENEEFEDDDFEQNKDVIFVLPGSGAKVVLDESTLRILNKTILTYTTELIGSTFKIAGGNMKSSCGCGSSFDVEASQ